MQQVIYFWIETQRDVHILKSLTLSKYKISGSFSKSKVLLQCTSGIRLFKQNAAKYNLEIQHKRTQ